MEIARRRRFVHEILETRVPTESTQIWFLQLSMLPILATSSLSHFYLLETLEVSASCLKVVTIGAFLGVPPLLLNLHPFPYP
jgi:hypothetical protein